MKKIIPLDLSLFDGGDGNSGAPAGGGATAGTPATPDAPGPVRPPAPPRPVPPPGAQQGAQMGAVPQAGAVPRPVPGPPPGAMPPLPSVSALLAQRQLRDWDAQARQVQERYPGFDLGREAQDRTFRSLLRSGVPLRQAFEVLHMDELRSQAERAVTENIKAKGARPPENGAGSASGFTVKDDVSRLTARDRAELARRAARGEVITF